MTIQKMNFFLALAVSPVPPICLVGLTTEDTEVFVHLHGYLLRIAVLFIRISDYGSSNGAALKKRGLDKKEVQISS